jgi:hypothetical protein
VYVDGLPAMRLPCLARSCHLSKLEGWVPDKELNKLRADHSLMHAPEPTQRLDCQPSSIRGNMKEYQLKGIAFMARMVSDGVGCILADEMGLGKTLQVKCHPLPRLPSLPRFRPVAQVGNGTTKIAEKSWRGRRELQTIALIAWMKIHQKEPGPCLVVVPLSVISSWIGEFKKWCPQVSRARIHLPGCLSALIRSQLQNWNQRAQAGTVGAFASMEKPVTRQSVTAWARKCVLEALLGDARWGASHARSHCSL